MSAAPGPTVRFRRNPAVLSRDLEGEAVLLEPGSGRYFSLNPTGRRVWQLLAEGPPIAACLATLTREFEAPAAVLERDLVALLLDLEREGLVLRADG